MSSTTLATTISTTNEFTIQGPITLGKKLYLCDEIADIHFICKSERVPAHKFLLINTSEVFQAMFNESWKEKTEVEIVDASAAAFREFLQFFYLGTVKLTMETIAEVMNLGNKYDVAECYECCAKYLKNHITNDDVCWCYELAIHLEHKGLEKFCEIMIAINTKAVLSSESFLQLDQKTVKRILQLDSLRCSEVELFEALMKWAKAKSAPEELTQDIFHCRYCDLAHEIRFGLMTIEEVAKIDSLYGNIFSIEEFREIIQMMASEEFQPKIFHHNRKNRFQSFEWDKCDVIECNFVYTEELDQKPYYLKSVEETAFKTNQSFLLRSFTCIDLSMYDDGDYHHMDEKKLLSTFKIVQYNDADDEVVLYDGKAELSTDYKSFIPLERPILIRSGFIYQIQMQQTVPEKCCTHVILKSVVNIKPDITVLFEGSGDTMARGIIERMEMIRI